MRPWVALCRAAGMLRMSLGGGLCTLEVHRTGAGTVRQALIAPIPDVRHAPAQALGHGLEGEKALLYETLLERGQTVPSLQLAYALGSTVVAAPVRAGLGG